MPPYTVVFRDKLGQLNEFSQHLVHEEVAALTERVLTALQTDKAISGFWELSEKWRLEHGAEFDVRESVNAFQDRLKKAINQPGSWPPIIVDFQMPKDQYGEIESRENSKNTFSIKKQRIRLNGLRVDMLRIDHNNWNHEWYPRWWEMFTTYCHEVAHMFITYLALTYKGDLTCGSPTFSSIDFLENPKESGFFLEKHIFGGILLRGRDTSSRKPRLMPGVPVYQVGRYQLRGIPLEKIIEIAERPPGVPYNSSDFDLDLYWPRGTPLNLENPGVDLEYCAPLTTEFGRWWEEYEKLFGVEFAQNIYRPHPTNTCHPQAPMAASVVYRRCSCCEGCTEVRPLYV